MAFNNYLKIITSFVLLFCLICIRFVSVEGSDSADSSLEVLFHPFTATDHLTNDIWLFDNSLNKPEKGLVLEMNNKQWEVLSAICVVPAYLGRESQMPLMFTNSNKEIITVFPYEIKTISTFGSDAVNCSAKLVTSYWQTAELVFTVDNYEQALWIVSSAAFLSAPILVRPTQNTIDSLNVKCLISLGESDLNVDHQLKLETQKDVWGFQLELFDTKGTVCNYLVITNPIDTDEDENFRIKWKFQSPAAALLAAYRKGIILTGDWSVDKTTLEALETSSEQDVLNYTAITPKFTKLKKDSYEIEQFLQSNGHTPKYLAAVGGPFSVPNFVYDIHVDYPYPTNNPQNTQYPSSLAAYATLSDSIAVDKYTKEDLAAGRLVAGSLFDLTKQLMRTFFYHDFLPEGKYYSELPTGWEEKACQIDGHRLNQPEPNNIYWDPNSPYHPHEELETIFELNGLSTHYYLPRNESDGSDSNPTIEGIMGKSIDYGYIHITPHGGETWFRIEVGKNPVTGIGEYRNLDSSSIRQLNYKAPSLIYTTSCKGGVWMLDQGYETIDFIPSSFISAGAVAYIATPEIQSTCFWREAPLGVATQQSTIFWNNLLSKNIPIGIALRDAKAEANEFWQGKTTDFHPTHDIDCISYTLFGDPALEIFKPNLDFGNTDQIDLNIMFDEILAGNDFNIEVTINDLNSQHKIENATIKITFEGVVKTGPTTTFSAPSSTGEYQVTILVKLEGYSDLQAKLWLIVSKDTDEPKEDKKNGSDSGFLPGFDGFAFAVTIALVLCVRFLTKKKRS